MDFEKIKHFLSKEYGGLPVWAWGVIGVGGLALGWYLVKGIGAGTAGGGTGGIFTAPTAPVEQPTQPPTSTPTPQPNPPTQPPPVDTGPVSPVMGGGDNGGGGPIQAPTNPIPVSSPIVLPDKQADLQRKQQLYAVQVKENDAVHKRELQAASQVGSVINSAVLNSAMRNLSNISGTQPQKATSQPIRTTAGRGSGNVAE